MVTGFEGTHRGMRPTGSIPVTPRKTNDWGKSESYLSVQV
jgi:hypothetical protein